MSEATSLDVPETQDCAFCDYLAGRRPYTILHRSLKSAILVTREQRGIAHLLVLPLAHRPTLLDVTADEAGDLMLEVQLAARLIDLAEHRPGIAIWQNNGAAVEQTIPHLHFHVAGSLPGGTTDRGEVPELRIAETDRIADRLRPFLGE